MPVSNQCRCFIIKKCIWQNACTTYVVGIVLAFPRTLFCIEFTSVSCMHYIQFVFALWIKIVLHYAATPSKEKIQF